MFILSRNYVLAKKMLDNEHLTEELQDFKKLRSQCLLKFRKGLLLQAYIFLTLLMKNFGCYYGL